MQRQRNVGQEHPAEHTRSVKGLVVWPKGLSLGRQCWKQYPAIPRDHFACEASEVPGWYHVFKASQSMGAWKAEQTLVLALSRYESPCLRPEMSYIGTCHDIERTQSTISCLDSSDYEVAHWLNFTRPAILTYTFLSINCTGGSGCLIFRECRA